MNRDELRALIRLVEESEIDELEIRRWGKTVRIVKNSGHPGLAAPALPVVPGAGNASGAEPAASTGAVGDGKPAHQVASPMVGTFYRAPAPEAPLSPPILDQAAVLGHDPVAIFEFVRNEIATEWYAGAMKGAEETLRQRTGNDVDQAARYAPLARGRFDNRPSAARLAELYGEVVTATVSAAA